MVTASFLQSLFRSGRVQLVAGSLVALACLSSTATRGEEPTDEGKPQSPQTVFRLPTPGLAVPSEHPDKPLRPVLDLARGAYEHVRTDVKDYTCIMVRRERVEGRLRSHEFIYAKVRHAREAASGETIPFSIYLKFLKPNSVAGREVLFVDGQNNGEIFARRGGTRFAFVTTRLDPNSELAMRGNRYPITEFGVENLLRRMIEFAENSIDAPCRVSYLEEATIDDRPTLGIVVTYSERESSPDCYQARIFVDRTLQLPIHFESYAWPTEQDDSPPLAEQYTYTKLKLNVGLTDADFSPENPQYQLQ